MFDKIKKRAQTSIDASKKAAEASIDVSKKVAEVSIDASKKAAEASLDAGIKAKDQSIKFGKKYIREKAIESIREKLEFAQKKENDFTKEQMRKMIAKEEKKIIKELGLRGGLTTILAMFGIANI